MYPAAQKWNKGFTGVVFQNNTGWEPGWEEGTLQESIKSRNKKFRVDAKFAADDPFKNLISRKEFEDSSTRR